MSYCHNYILLRFVEKGSRALSPPFTGVGDTIINSSNTVETTKPGEGGLSIREPLITKRNI